MKDGDSHQFKKATKTEFDAHSHRKYWEVISLDDVPEGEKVLDFVWAMRRKNNILTNEIYKHKARLNIHEGQQEFAINFFDTYSPVVNWFAIRILLIHTVIFKWHTRQIDFVLAYPQADTDIPLYMKVLFGIKVKGKKEKRAVLKLRKNIYGQKQAGRVWSKHITSKLKKIGFEPSEVDECKFYKGSCLFFFYVDDGILLSPDKKEVNKAIDDLKVTGLEL